jgi:hypothetical protein
MCAALVRGDEVTVTGHDGVKYSGVVHVVEVGPDCSLIVYQCTCTHSPQPPLSRETAGWCLLFAGAWQERYICRAAADLKRRGFTMC